MNYGISVLFRAIPLAMGVICLSFGWFVFTGGDDPPHRTAGHVLMSLTGLGAVCFTLFSIVSILEAGTSKKG